MNTVDAQNPHRGRALERIWGCWSQAMGCLGLILVTIALLAVGSCEWQDMRTKASIRDHLPAQYRDGEFAYFKQCDHGFTYIFKLSPAAAQKLRANAAVERSGAQNPPFWGPEPGEGLGCWGEDYPYKDKPQRLEDHLNLADSYMREHDHYSYTYFVPSLGVIAGGNETR